MLKLSDEFARLNDEQRAAVLIEGNTAVMAGPGSGKTATLVIKIAHLINETIVPPAGLACLTYNNDAVREFRTRLGDMGIFSRRSLFLGTVHSFCLNCIVRPYAGLVDKRFQSGVKVAGQRVSDELFEKAVGQFLDVSQARWMTTAITRYRRAEACDEDLSGFAKVDLQIAKTYADLLLNSGVIDFEGIILLALHLVQRHKWIRNLIASRFPWIIVDEYQDLGGPLHLIVTKLVDLAGIKIFAVGDPDQTIYDFTGASPKYLIELTKRKDFTPIRLKFNYRSGQKIIDASQAALAPTEPRGYAPDPIRKEQGEIVFGEADGSDADHAKRVLEAVKSAIASGIAPQEIAVLYRSVGSLIDAIRGAFDREAVEYFWERDTRFPSSPIIRWLQQASAWSLANANERETTFSRLFHDLHLLLQAAGQVGEESLALDYRISLFRLLTQPSTRNASLCSWLADVEKTLGLRELLQAAEEYADDLDKYDQLSDLICPNGAQHETPLHEFAAGGRFRHKVVITTFHASKGRQFDVVVIPGCAEGVLPAWTWNKRCRDFEPPTDRVLAETRRLFYVGLSRARHTVHLIHADSWQDQFGKMRSNGLSRFVTEIQRKLN